jgi:hypothetical protein
MESLRKKYMCQPKGSKITREEDKVCLLKEGSSWIEVSSTGMVYTKINSFFHRNGLVRNECDHNLYIRTLVIRGQQIHKILGLGSESLPRM